LAVRLPELGRELAAEQPDSRHVIPRLPFLRRQAFVFGDHDGNALQEVCTRMPPLAGFFAGEEEGGERQTQEHWRSE
jgi:hypothetical protein